MPPFAKNYRKMYCEFHPRVHIFLVTFEWAQEARMLQYTRFKRWAKDKHSSLLGPIVSYEEDKVFVNFSPGFVFSL
jgi:hypothetical protein